MVRALATVQKPKMEWAREERDASPLLSLSNRQSALEAESRGKKPANIEKTHTPQLQTSQSDGTWLHDVLTHWWPRQRRECRGEGGAVN